MLKDIKIIFDGDPENDSDDGCEKYQAQDLADTSQRQRGQTVGGLQSRQRHHKESGSAHAEGFRDPDTKSRCALATRQLKGYQSEWFKNAFERYLPQTPPTTFETEHPEQVNENESLEPIFETEQRADVPDRKSEVTTEKQSDVPHVPLENSQREALRIFGRRNHPKNPKNDPGADPDDLTKEKLEKAAEAWRKQ